jgi:biopolymer transport protein ExbD
MRRGLIGMALLAASCSPPGDGNGSDGAGAARGPEPTAVIAAAGGGEGGCSFSWNGEEVTQDQLLERGVMAIQRAIEEVGGIEALTDKNMPFLRLEAASNAPYSCTGPALRAMERAGFADVVLRPSADRAADHRIDLPLGPPPASRHPEMVPIIVRIEKDGRLTWDGTAIDSAGLRERLGAARSMAPPVDLFVAPSADSDFMALYETMRTIEAENMEATLSGCAGTPGPIREGSPVC